jgi:hypothetical protein
MRNVDEKKWNKQYEKLVEFKRKHGHCLVPQRHQDDVALWNWVSNQRKLHSKNTLRHDRKGLLEDIGFVWSVEDHQWHLHYEKMVEFKRKTDHCIVPRTHQEDMSLGAWVNRQRQLHSKNKIRPGRKGLLEELGFAWKADTGAARSSTTDVSCR